MSTENQSANDLQVLSTLLGRERPEDSSIKVKEILASHHSLAEKISLIEGLDKKDEEKKNSHSSYLSRPKKSPQSEEKQDTNSYIIDVLSAEAAAEVRAHRSKLSSNRKMIKPLIKSSSFFSYLFGERKKIKAFCTETGILQLRAFFMKLQLNPRALARFEKNISPVIEQLLKSLKFVLETGWYYLEKRDYNLVIMLYKLCRELKLINYTTINPKSLHSLDRFLNAENVFLTLHYDSADMKEVIYAVDSVFSKDPSKLEVQKETSVNIHRLLEEDILKPSLYNFLRALNILKVKRFLTLEDLKSPGLQLIDGHDFNCTPKVREKIDDYLRKLEKGIKPYLDQEREMYRLHAFLPSNDEGIIDFTQLKNFYDRVHQSKKLSFEYNKDNIMKFILNFGYGFLIAFREVLSEKTLLDIGIEFRIFAQPIFGQDLERIEYNLGKLDKIQTILPKFATSRCLSIKKSTSGAIESEAEAVRHIYEIAGTLVTMGKRLAHILRYDIPLNDENENRQEVSYFSYAENTYYIPAENNKIDKDGYLRGSTIKDSLFQITALCYQLGAFVEHSELTDLLAKEKKTRDEIRIRTIQYKRIAHESVYLAFLEKYDLS